MMSLNDSLDSDVIDALATSSNGRLGRALASGDEIEIIESDDQQASAWVGGGPSGSQRRQVNLTTTGDTLAWSCSCTNDPDLFCKHLVAAALVLSR